jgi:uncharacterized membrane protein YvbJ
VTRPRRTFLCPHCGAQVDIGSASCRECGSDAATGWQDSEEVDYQSLDLPEGYAADADDRASPIGARSRVWFWVALALLLVVLVYVTVVVLRMAGLLR